MCGRGSYIPDAFSNLFTLTLILMSCKKLYWIKSRLITHIVLRFTSSMKFVTSIWTCFFFFWIKLTIINKSRRKKKEWSQKSQFGPNYTTFQPITHYYSNENLHLTKLDGFLWHHRSIIIILSDHFVVSFWALS